MNYNNALSSTRRYLHYSHSDINCCSYIAQSIISTWCSLVATAPRLVNTWHHNHQHNQSNYLHYSHTFALISMHWYTCMSTVVLMYLCFVVNVIAYLFLCNHWLIFYICLLVFETELSNVRPFFYLFFYVFCLLRNYKKTFKSAIKNRTQI